MAAGDVVEVTAQSSDAATSSDALLLRRLRKHEPGAFEELVREEQDRVFEFCVRMLGDRDEAFDVAQEIFLSVHQHVDNFREDSKLSTWIYRISKNHCINRLKYLRRRGRGRSDDVTEVSEAALSDAVGTAPHPDEAIETERQRRVVQRAMEKLDPDQRLLVTLRDVEGLSYEEIVEITELPLGTVKSRLHRARENLTEIVTQELER